jgi:predicted short-subunit dehydrogenase-like oxidoreductase (DUF2520 family)
MSTTLNILGAGRVGQTLARLWHEAGVFQIQDVLNTSLASTQQAIDFIGAGTPVAQLHAMRAADIWMLAMPDSHIANTAKALAGHTLATTPPIAFHCSGALSADTLAPLKIQGWYTASAHCILSFASAKAAVTQFAGTACALEGDAHACATLRSAFSSIAAQCFGIASADKLRYHAAAVFATNFIPVLQATAEDLWRSVGVPAALIPGLRTSLLRNAVVNITERGPQAALTGPAARGDTEAIERQAKALGEWDAPTAAAYEALSALALRLAHKTQD